MSKARLVLEDRQIISIGPHYRIVFGDITELPMGHLVFDQRRTVSLGAKSLVEIAGLLNKAESELAP